MTTPSCDISLVILASGVRPDLVLFREMIETYRNELEALGREYEILVVDDGVGGPFFSAVKDLRVKIPQIRAIRFRRSFGESVALCAAVDHARGHYLITSTWYLQVDPAGLRRAIDLLDSGVDFVSGRRQGRVDGFVARFQSWVFNSYTRWITKAPLRDLNCSFRAFRKEVVEELSFHGDLFRFIAVLALQQGFRVEELPLQHRMERGPTTYLSPGIVLRRLLDILSLFFLIKFTRKPLRFFGMVGTIFFTLGAGVSARMLYLRLVQRVALADKPLLILGIFLLVLGIIVSSIGLIGEIIIFTLSKEIRDYHVDRIIEGGSDTAVKPASCALSSELRITPLNTHYEDSWTDYVAHHEDATLFHELVWRDVLLDTFSHRPLYTLAFRGSQVVGVLPLMVIRSMFFGTSAVSVPFGVYGGLLADDAEVAAKLIERARQDTKDAGAAYAELRHMKTPAGVDLPQSDLYYTFIKELPETEEECLGLFPRKARAEARKARKNEELSVEIDTMDVGAFHRLFAANKRKLGSPPFPRSLFWHLQEHLGERSSILSINYRGEPVAAVMSFIHRDTYMAYYSGATDEANSLSANNLLYLAAMEDAVRRGLRFFDFGRSRAGTGSFRFKKHQGFEATPLAYHYLLEEGQELPAINASNPRYNLGKKVFRMLPRFAAEKMGSFVAKRMPV